MQHIRLEEISIKNHPDINEAWVQDVIADDPSILGLGDVIVRDKERRQPRAGRLDLLLQDPDTNKRYEVEVQLGITDESHIIRTIEYWDLERKRYPQYDHCAVIVAEDITSRFLNVVSLFNGFIPLIAIQMTAVRVDDGIGLNFTKVLDELALGLAQEDEEISEPADRDYWLQRGSEKTVNWADELLELIKSISPNIQFKYNKFYIGLAEDGITNNFVMFKPKKKWVTVEVKMAEDQDLTSRLTDSDLDWEYLAKWRRYRIRIGSTEFEKDRELLHDLFAASKADREA